jgi:restriction system protein
LCADALQLLGYRSDLGGIRLVPNNADLVLRLGDAPVLVHCSRWRSLHVGIREVREFYDDVLHQGALRGIFVTSGTFTGPATQFAHGKPLSLIDGDRLSALLWDLRQRRGGSIASLAARQRAAAPAPRQFRRKSVDGASATATAETAQVPVSLPMGPEDKTSRSRSGELQ